MKLNKLLIAALLICAMLCCGARADVFDNPKVMDVKRGADLVEQSGAYGILRIPEGIAVIEDYAFYGCTGITGVPIIPWTVGSIGAHAFDGCTGLDGVLYLPMDMEVDDTAFINCPDLTVIRVDGQIPVKVALVVDEGGVEDGGFNQLAYVGAHDYCEAHDLDFEVYTNNDGMSALRSAVRDGCTVVFFNGFTYAETIAEAQNRNPQIRLIGLDIAADDLGVEPSDNVFCASYKEHEAGFMAGYAAVCLGKRHLGFLGGMPIPAILHYGYGFVQGANAAAVKMNIADQVDVKIGYANQFGPSAELEERMMGWYQGGIETIFACGGGIWGSVGAAAMRTSGTVGMGTIGGAVVGNDGKGKVIGVDADQAQEIDRIFGEGITLTSAIKALDRTVAYVLDAIVNDRWAELGGKANVLGVTSAQPEANHVGLAASTQFGTGFLEADYINLLVKICDGTYVISDSTDDLPEISISVVVES